jgi:hypothetical protein
MVLMHQLSFCLINFSHTFVHGLARPLRITEEWSKRTSPQSESVSFGGPQPDKKSLDECIIVMPEGKCNSSRNVWQKLFDPSEPLDFS